MFTVLVIPSEQKDSFTPFSSLFTRTIQEGKMAICTWYENAYTINDALPELEGILENQREWRTIIVCTEKSIVEEKEYKVDSFNPFEYGIKPKLEMIQDEIVDRASPLVRLTHMLTAEIPVVRNPLELTLNYPEVASEGEEQNQLINGIPSFKFTVAEKDPKVVEEERTQEAYRQIWMKEHELTFAAPIEIALVKVKPIYTEAELLRSIKTSWKVHTEFESSEFWKRNRYPQNCRFLTYETKKKGQIQKQHDLFNLWCAVLLMIENNIEPSLLQAHRVYDLGIQVKNDELGASFQTTINKLNRLHYLVEKKLRQEEEQIESDSNVIPDYRLNVDVESRPSNTSDVIMERKDIGLTGGNASLDKENWKKYVEGCDDALYKAEKESRRRIDVGADRSWVEKEYYYDEVYQLNRFVEEDMQDELYDLNSEILSQQSSLPRTLTDIKQDLKEIDEDVQKNIVSRMTGKQVVGVIVLFVFILVMMFLPSIIVEGFSWEKLFIFGVGTAVILLGLFILLNHDRRVLLDIMKKFQNTVINSFEEITNRSDRIVKNLSDMFSHIHGASFLKKMNLQKEQLNGPLFEKKRTLSEIESLIDKLGKWNMAMNLNLNMRGMAADTESGSLDEIVDDISVDSIHLLPEDRNVRVPINESGIYVSSPYGFIKKLIIERVELYDEDEEEEE